MDVRRTPPFPPDIRDVDYHPRGLIPERTNLTRRTWLRTLATFVAGGAAGAALIEGLGLRWRPASPPTVPEWLVAMRAATDAELIERAGEFEFAARRESPVPGAVAAFTRLLRVASPVESPTATVAVKSAVRALVHQGGAHVVESWLAQHEKSARHRELVFEARRVLGLPEARR